MSQEATDVNYFDTTFINGSYRCVEQIVSSNYLQNSYHRSIYNKHRI